MNSPKLSIITVNLNNKEGLQKTIDSVVNQTCQDFEWIIIDGGSLDGSKELIDKYNAYVDFWVSEPDKGIYNGMNKGIVASHGEYLLFLNSGDCLYNIEVIKKVIPLLNNEDIYLGQEVYVDRVFKWDNFDLCKLCRLLSTKSLTHQSMFFKRQLFQKYGLYNENYKVISDWIFFNHSILMGSASIKVIPFIISIFYSPGISQSTLNLKEREIFFEEIPRIKELTMFYWQNYDIIRVLKNSKILFFLFRLYYFFYRWHKN